MKIIRIIIPLVITIVASLVVQSQTVSNSTDKFEIIYLADGKYAANTSWLKKMRDD